MLSWIRWLAAVVAGIWLGAAVFLTVGAGPAFFSPAMLELMPRETAGLAAQLILSRYFVLVQILGIAAALLLFLETRLQPAGGFRRRWLLLVGIVGLGAFVGYGLQPRLKELHRIRYAPETSAEVRESSRKTFGMLHGVSQSANLLMLVGVLVHFTWAVRGAEAERKLEG
jgi:hypothetical protein